MIQQLKQDDDIDKQLLDLAKKFKTLIDEYLEKAEKGLEVLLLVGNTGAGKSTIFNVLAGAEFEYDEKDLLKIKKTNEKFSLMNSGMKSVTKQPKYFFNDEKNHLLIDFPGFKDTEGVLDQLMIQMLFLKIVTLSPTKIIYVIRSPERKLPDRGESLQSFIKEQFQGQDLDSSKFTLLLNSYADKLSEIKLIENIKDDLSKIQPIPNDNIIVLRKVDDEETLQQHLSQEKRDELWGKLIKSNKIDFHHNTLPCSEKVSEYVRKHTSCYLQEYFQLFDQTMHEKGSELTEIILNKLTVLIEQLNEIVITIDKKQIIASFSKFMQKFKEIITFLTRREPQLLVKSKEFMEVFEVYSQFSDFIKGYQECFEELINSKAKCELMKLTVIEKLQKIKEKKEQEEKQRKREEEIAEQQKKIALEQERLKHEAELTQLRMKHMEEQYKKDLEIQRAQHQMEMSRQQSMYSSQITAERNKNKKKKKKKKTYQSSYYY